MIKKCPKCGCEGLWSNGFVGKKKRYKCQNCEYQFTKEKPKEYPHEMKLEAVKLLKEGVGIRGIGRLLNVSMETVRRWIKQLAVRVFQAKITEEIEDIQVDGMCIKIKKKELKNGYGLLILPNKNEFWTLKLEIDQQELLINSLRDLKKNIKSNNIQPIIIQFIKN